MGFRGGRKRGQGRGQKRGQRRDEEETLKKHPEKLTEEEEVPTDEELDALSKEGYSCLSADAMEKFLSIVETTEAEEGQLDAQAAKKKKAQQKKADNKRKKDLHNWESVKIPMSSLIGDGEGFGGLEVLHSTKVLDLEQMVKDAAALKNAKAAPKPKTTKTDLKQKAKSMVDMLMDDDDDDDYDDANAFEPEAKQKKPVEKKKKKKTKKAAEKQQKQPVEKKPVEQKKPVAERKKPAETRPTKPTEPANKRQRCLVAAVKKQQVVEAGDSDGDDEEEVIEPANSVAEEGAIGEDEEASGDDGEGESSHCEDETFRTYLCPEVLRGVREMGFTTATPIQRMCLPLALRDRKDIVAAAQTGSGKTSAFGLPILHTLFELATATNRAELKQEAYRSQKSAVAASSSSSSSSNDVEDENTEEQSTNNKPRLWALILVPTRELAVQVSAHISEVGKHTGLKLISITGGLAEEKQVRLLGKMPEIIVATPGRLWAMLQNSKNTYLADFSDLRFLVIDEADRMVEKGHFAELRQIVDLVNSQTSSSSTTPRQTFLFSATLDHGTSVDDMLELIKFQGQVTKVDLTTKQLLSAKLTELSIEMKIEDKDAYLLYCLMSLPAGRSLVFVNSIDCLRRMIPLLRLLKFDDVYPLHSEMQQRQRLKNLDRFRATTTGVLIASDVASRGLDIPAVNYVIHYQIARTFELYVHRSGRTARAEREGVSIEFVGPTEKAMYLRNHRQLGRGALPELPVDGRVMRLVRKRVEIARKLEMIQHANLKRDVHNNWLSKAAEEADIIVERDQFDRPEQDERRKEKMELLRLTRQLEQNLAQKIHFNTGIHSLRYPTLHYDQALVSSLNSAYVKQQEIIPFSKQ